MNKQSRKAQAALEFLMTYGWAILVVLVAIGALAYFGVLSPDQFLPNKCTLQAGVACLDHKATATGVTVVIQNSMGYDLANVSVTATGCGTVNGTSLANGDKATYTIGCNLTGSKYSGDLDFAYTNTDTGLSKTNKGTITAAIE